MLDQEETTHENTSTTATDEVTDPHETPQYHAVVVTGGKVQVLSHRVKSKLAKQLGDIGEYTLVGVIKGKFVKTRPSVELV